MTIADDLRAITRQHVETAAAEIDAGRGAAAFGPSRDYDASVRGKRYPPKQLVGTAARLAIGRELAPNEFDGGNGPVGANRVLEALGFQILPKGDDSPPPTDGIDFAELVEPALQADPSVSHNLAVWRAVIGGTEMAFDPLVDFDPRADFWHPPEHRFLVAYLSNRWPRWPSSEDKHAPLAEFAVMLSRRMAKLRAEGKVTYLGVDYDEAGGVEAVLAPIRADVQAMDPVPDWESVRASSDSSPTARQSLELFLDQILREGFDSVERALGRSIMWWPVLGASTVAELEANQRFFWSYRHALMSNNAYAHAGAQYFGPIINNTKTSVLLDAVRRWRDGALPEDAPMLGLGKDDDEPSDRSHTNIARELWGFLNLHRCPFYNNQVAVYAAYGDTPEKAVRAIGEQCHAWLADNPGPRKQLAEQLETLVRAAKRSGKTAFAEARRYRPGKGGSALDERLRAELVEKAVARMKLLSEADRAAILLHLALDSVRRGNRPEAETAREPTPAEGYDVGGTVGLSLRAAERVWIYAPGEGANHWPFDRDNEVASIGWEDEGDLLQYETEEAVYEALRQNREGNVRPFGDTKTCWDFSRRVAVGDPIVARKGRSRIIGIGIVQRTYFWVEGESYPGRVGVRWIWTGDYVIQEKRSLAVKTLVESSRRKRLMQELDALLRHAETEAGEVAVAEVEPAEVEAYTRDTALADLFIPDAQVDQMLALLERRKNLILQGPPGVGKTFVAKRLAYLLMGEKAADRVVTVQFHQAYTYEQFVRGYRPKADGGFELASGPLFELAQTAQGDPNNDYALIIDEINRGNLSKILGEAMMLLEADKRSPEWALQLAYAVGTDDEEEERFYLPDNLYVIGTMNTADRSLAVVDYALRRRFVFVDLRPGFEQGRFADHLAELPPQVLARIRGRMAALNQLILGDPNLGAGFEVGHSYFARGNLAEAAPWADGADAWVDAVFEFEILPLLREYWYDEPTKLADARAILGLTTA